MHQEMMNEQHDPTFCQTYDNHACNILSTKYAAIGIGIYHAPSGSTWLTEDFIR